MSCSAQPGGCCMGQGSAATAPSRQACCPEAAAAGLSRHSFSVHAHVQVMRSIPDPVQRAWLGADELLVALDPATNRLLRYEPCRCLRPAVLQTCTLAPCGWQSVSMLGAMLSTDFCKKAEHLPMPHRTCKAWLAC